VRESQLDHLPMHVRLPQDLEDLIARKVEAGEYETPTDVLIHAIYLLDAYDRARQEQLKALRAEIAIGIEQCERGETKPFTRRTLRRISAGGRKRLIQEAERLRAEADRLVENAKLAIDETTSAE
jgi:Arc/MetJ-type ribon-helix-helix transcriptional regulator